VTRAAISARVVAIDALVRIEAGAYAHVLVPAMLGSTSLAPRDRAFVTDLVYGTTRARARLDDLLARVVNRPFRRLDPPVRATLRLGAYQLLEGIPPHAAVSATVDALGTRSPRARGFVNANLRALTRLGPPWPEPAELADNLSYPRWLVDQLERDLGATTAHEALRAMNEPAAVTLRPNPARTTPDALESELHGAGIDVERGTLVPSALLVRGVGDLAQLPAVRDGRATPQDQASQAVVALLKPIAGERIADVAAAPGGKAAAIGELVGDHGHVAAVDIDEGRIRLVATAAARLGLHHVTAAVADGRALPLRRGWFDRVLVDAPCSGIGVLRRRPDARWRLEPRMLPELASLQQALLLRAAELVRPDGTLVYSVCTLTRDETIGIDEWVAEHLVDFDAVPFADPAWLAHGRGGLLLPQTAGTDGMFVLRLRRVRSSPSRSQ
jgi:16S rRNA (cytosine967-C5)-methyltransferase